MLLAYAAFVLIGISAGAGGVLLLPQIADYGVDKATIGITFFASSGGFLLAAWTAGALVHRLGIRLALVTGGATFALAALCLAAHPPFALMIAVQVVVGYGTGVLESVLNVYLTGLPSATTLLNRLHAFFGVGALVGPLLAAGLLRVWPWTAVWLVMALVALLLTVGFLVAYPVHVRPEPADADPARRSLFGSVVRMPAVLLASLFLSVYVGLELGVGNWAYSFLVEQHGETGLVAGYSVSGYWLGLTLGRFLISPVATRLRMTTADMTSACLVGVTATAALIWLAPVAAVATVGFVTLGFFLGPLVPTAMAIVPDLTESRYVPTAIGLMNGMSVFGGSALPWLAGATAQGVGAWTLMPFALTLALVQFAVWRLLVARMARRARTPELISNDA